jgi:hypothetical protein
MNGKTGMNAFSVVAVPKEKSGLRSSHSLFSDRLWSVPIPEHDAAARPNRRAIRAIPNSILGKIRRIASSFPDPAVAGIL